MFAGYGRGECYVKLAIYFSEIVKKYVLISLSVIFLFVGSIFPLTKCSADSSGTEKIPILMYHGVLKGSKSIGKYIVSSDELEGDLQYLRDNGYTTILIQELIDHVKNGTDLPEKPIILTFDDGYYNNYIYAYEICQRYNAKMVISLIVKQTDIYSENGEVSTNYSHITWEQAKEMLSSGLVEIQNHSYDLHSSNGRYVGITKAKWESPADYEIRVTSDIQKAQNRIIEMTGYTPTTFTYPFGLIDESAKNAIQKMGFEASLLVENKVALLDLDDENCLMGLKRCIRPGNTSTFAVMNKYKI